MHRHRVLFETGRQLPHQYHKYVENLLLRGLRISRDTFFVEGSEFLNRNGANINSNSSQLITTPSLSSSRSSDRSSAVTALDHDRADCRYLLVGREDGSISMFDTIPPLKSESSFGILSSQTSPPYIAQPLFQSEWDQGSMHRGSVTGTLWYPFDSGIFVTAGMDGKVQVWDSNRLQVAQQFVINFRNPANAGQLGSSAAYSSFLGLQEHAQEKCPVLSSAMSPLAAHHSLIATASKAGVQLCDLISGSNAHTLLGHHGEVCAVTWSTSNEHMLISGGADRTIRTWDVRRPGTVMVLDEENNGRPPVAKDACGHLGHNRRDRQIQSHDDSVCHLHVSPDGSHLLSSGLDQKLKMWELTSGHNTMLNFPQVTNSNRLQRFAWSSLAGSQYVFYPNGKNIHMYSTTGRMVKSLQGHFDSVLCLTPHPHLPKVYSGSADGSILCWSNQSLSDRTDGDNKGRSQSSDMDNVWDPPVGWEYDPDDVDDWSSDDESNCRGGNERTADF